MINNIIIILFFNTNKSRNELLSYLSDKYNVIVLRRLKKSVFELWTHEKLNRFIEILYDVFFTAQPKYIYLVKNPWKIEPLLYDGSVRIIIPERFNVEVQDHVIMECYDINKIPDIIEYFNAYRITIDAKKKNARISGNLKNKIEVDQLIINACRLRKPLEIPPLLRL